MSALVHKSKSCCRCFCPSLLQVRTINKNYDKVVKLLPERIEYKYKDKRFLPGPRPEDTAFPRLSRKEICELSRVKLEHEIAGTNGTEVDRTKHPFNQIFANQPTDRFTKVQRVDESRWPWVERLLPKPVAPHPPGQPGQVKPSGFVVPPRDKPTLSYFIPRTRTFLFPIYLQYSLPKEAVKYRVTGWITNKWKWCYINNPYKDAYSDPTIVTLVKKIQGDIWKCEEDLRGYVEEQHQKRVLSAVNEVQGTIKLKGDYIKDVVSWMTKTGF